MRRGSSPYAVAVLRYAAPMNERDAKFFRPLWIRVGVTGVLVVWFALETLLSHDNMWITITGIGIAYCVWNFFLRFPKETPPSAPTDAPPPAPPTQP